MQPEDLEEITPDNVVPDPTRRHHAEPQIIDDQLPRIFDEQTRTSAPQNQPPPGPLQVRICVPLTGAPVAPAALLAPVTIRAPIIPDTAFSDSDLVRIHHQAKVNQIPLNWSRRRLTAFQSTQTVKLRDRK